MSWKGCMSDIVVNWRRQTQQFIICFFTFQICFLPFFYRKVWDKLQCPQNLYHGTHLTSAEIFFFLQLILSHISESKVQGPNPHVIKARFVLSVRTFWHTKCTSSPTHRHVWSNCLLLSRHPYYPSHMNTYLVTTREWFKLIWN